MTRLYERILTGGASRRSGAGMSLDDLLPLFRDPGAFLTTTWGTAGPEEVVWSAGETYRRSGPVFALIEARIQVFSQAQFRWTRGQGGNPRDIFGTQALSLIEKPWPGARTPTLLAQMELGASAAGNAFVRRLRRGAGPTLEDRLVVLPPQNVKIVLGSLEQEDNPEVAADAEVIGYLYLPPGGKAVLLQPHEVAHYAPLPDPAARFRGMSWITPVLVEVQADSASEAHKLKFFEHAATPNLALKFDPTVTAKQVREFKELMEAEHAGAWNAYKTLYVGGGADPVVIGKDFVQLDFSKTQGKGESRLAAAAGVPPSWAGFSEGLQGSALNAGNFDAAARRRLGDGTMQHLWQAAAASLESLFADSERPAGCMLWPDLRFVPFLRDDAQSVAATQQTKAGTISTLISAGFTPESAVAAIDAADLTMLVHTGLTSVQLQAASAVQNKGAAQAATEATDTGGTTP